MVEVSGCNARPGSGGLTLQVGVRRRAARTDGRRATEVDVAVHALDRLPELSCPNCVRTA